MSRILVNAIFSLTLFSFSSCYNDSEEHLQYFNNCDTSLAKGPLFTKVDSLITSRCNGAGCHVNGERAGGYNFDNVCAVVSAWSNIQSSCVSNSRMPLGSPFNSSERLIISTWIDAGHRYDN